MNRWLLAILLGLVPSCGSSDNESAACPPCAAHQKCGPNATCVADAAKKWVLWPQEIKLAAPAGAGAMLRVQTSSANYKYPLHESELVRTQTAAEDGFSTASVTELVSGIEVDAERIETGGSIQALAPSRRFVFTDDDIAKGTKTFDGWGGIQSITFGLRALAPDPVMATTPLWPELNKRCDGSPASCPSDLKCTIQCTKTCPSVGPGPEYGCPTGAFCYAFDGIVVGTCARICNTDADCGDPSLACKDRSATERYGLKICVLP